MSPNACSSSPARKVLRPWGRTKSWKPSGDCSAQGGQEWATGEDGVGGLQEGVPPLAQRRSIAPDAAIRVRASVSAEAPRDFLLHLVHAQILLRLVVIEGKGEVVQEGEHLGLAEPELLEPIPCGR